MKKRLLIVFMVLAMVASMFAGCQAAPADQDTPDAPSADEQVSAAPGEPTESEESEEPVTISFVNYSAIEGNAETIDRMKETFEAQNPNITVEIETLGYDDYYTQLQTRIAGSNAPDCFELEFGPFVSFADEDVLYDISSMMSGIDTNVVSQSSLDAFKYNGANVALPYSYSTCILVYNKDLFDEAGIAYPDDTWTWEDINTAGEAIKALGDDHYGIIQPVSTYELFKVVAQNGGSLLNEDNTQFTVNSPENVETLTYLCDRILNTNIAPTAQQMGSLDEWGVFMQGNTGMIVTGIWCFTRFAEECDFEWDICVEPGNTAKATHYFANGLAVSGSTQKAEAAYKWIEFLSTGHDMAMARVEAGWELPCASYDDVLALYLETTPPENKQAVFDSLEYVVSQPKITEFSQMGDILNTELQAAAAGQKTPQQALDDAQAELETVIDLTD